jgi:hypothetical protein
MEVVSITQRRSLEFYHDPMPPVINLIDEFGTTKDFCFVIGGILISVRGSNILISDPLTEIKRRPL